jgi:hypothetical protein
MLNGLLPYLLLAQVEPGKQIDSIRDAARNNSGKGLGMDLMVILGILLSLGAILFFWAFFIRKRPRHARGALVMRTERDESHGSGGRRRRRKRRPEHPDNWGRNPTLGETGGLPPSRPEQPDTPSEPESPPAR